MKKNIFVVITFIMVIWLSGCGKKEQVVVYTAVDQVYADKIFEEFEEMTGIEVMPV